MSLKVPDHNYDRNKTKIFYFNMKKYMHLFLFYFIFFLKFFILKNYDRQNQFFAVNLFTESA
jgi:hypothetical protein